MKKNLTLGICLLLLALLSACTPEVITNFEECVAAGYLIMESYPEQCRTANGEVFTKEITEVITNFEECVAAGYPVMESFPEQCKSRSGEIFSRDVSMFTGPYTECTVSSDCTLINGNYGWNCCWIGACDRVDHTLDSWIAVNKEWLETGQENNCPSKIIKEGELHSECGIRPMCDGQPINENYKAICDQKVCEKVLK